MRVVAAVLVALPNLIHGNSNVLCNLPTYSWYLDLIIQYFEGTVTT